MALGLAERLQTQRAIVEVRRVQAAAERAVSWDVTDAQRSAWGAGITDGQRAARKALADNGPLIERWVARVTDLETGRPGYTLAMWLEHGRELAEAASFYAKVDFDSSLFQMLKGSVTDTGRDLARIAQPSQWSSSAQLAAAAVVLAVVYYFLLKPSSAST